MCLLILNLKLFRRTGQRKALNKNRIPESDLRGKNLLTLASLQRLGMATEKQIIRISSRKSGNGADLALLLSLIHYKLLSAKTKSFQKIGVFTEVSTLLK